jgi:hypothetical protein
MRAFITAIGCALAIAVIASPFAATAQNCTTVGSNTICTDGSTSTTVGGNTIRSDGTTCTQVGSNVICH